MSVALDSRPDAALDVAAIRADFPILERKIHGRPLVYLDSAASALTPRPVVERLRRFHEYEYANIHRGAHQLSAEATAAYEEARATVARFIGAAAEQEVVFTAGCTAAINLVASCLGELPGGQLRGGQGELGVGEGDEVIVSELEHHSNFLPWQRLCERRGARLIMAPIDDEGLLDVEAFARLLGARTKLVAIAHVSNVLGTEQPLAEVIARAHAVGAKVLVDGAQGVVHLPVDVQALGCDFYTFSGHKLYGPTGVGVLWGRRELLDALPPYQVGGGTIDQVSIEGSTYLPAPLRFEAGTPPIAEVLGLAAAIDWLEGLAPDGQPLEGRGMAALQAHEQTLGARAIAALEEIPGLRLLGSAGSGKPSSVLSMVLEGVHPSDVGTLLDQQGIAVRIGHHCAQPLMRRLGVPATTRASFGVYNTLADVDALAAGLRKVIDLFG